MIHFAKKYIAHKYLYATLSMLGQVNTKITDLYVSLQIKDIKMGYYYKFIDLPSF